MNGRGFGLTNYPFKKLKYPRKINKQTGPDMELFVTLSLGKHWRSYHRGRKEMGHLKERVSPERKEEGVWGLCIQNRPRQTNRRLFLSDQGWRMEKNQPAKKATWGRHIPEVRGPTQCWTISFLRRPREVFEKLPEENVNLNLIK